MFVYLEGNGQTTITVSDVAIKSYTGRPEMLRAFSAKDAVRLFGLAGKGEWAYVQADTEEELQQIRDAIDEKVREDLNRDPRSWG